MSASISPTRCPPPRRASATARFAETVDLPTPPLPDEIARTVPRWGSSTGVGGGGTPPGPGRGAGWRGAARSEEHTSELQSRLQLVCRLLLGKKKDQRIRLATARCADGAACVDRLMTRDTPR